MRTSQAGIDPVKEEWRPVPGYEGAYEVSDWGQVRSLARVLEYPQGFSKSVPPRILKVGLASNGYPTVSLWRNNRGRTHCVHVAVAAAFLGPCPEGLEVLHGSSDRTDNRASNLRYGTRKENCADQLRDGTHIRGARHGSAKLNEAQVRLARRIYALQDRPKGLITDLANAWGVGFGAVHSAATGKTWAWLTQTSYS